MKQQIIKEFKKTRKEGVNLYVVDSKDKWKEVEELIGSLEYEENNFEKLQEEIDTWFEMLVECGVYVTVTYYCYETNAWIDYDSIVGLIAVDNGGNIVYKKNILNTKIEG